MRANRFRTAHRPPALPSRSSAIARLPRALLVALAISGCASESPDSPRQTTAGASGQSGAAGNGGNAGAAGATGGDAGSSLAGQGGAAGGSGGAAGQGGAAGGVPDSGQGGSSGLLGQDGGGQAGSAEHEPIDAGKGDAGGAGNARPDAGGAPTDAGGGTVGASGLPLPPGANTVAKPAGTPGDITVVNWAGFKGAVTYSFDDDNTSQIQGYPSLQALGVPFTFYLWTGKTEASNSVWTTALKDGHEIGNHTQSHDPDSHCTTADVNTATEFIQSKLSVKPWTMAAPNGNACFKNVAQGLFFINRGVGPAQPVLPNSNSDPLNLNCYIPATGQQASTFNANVDDGRTKGGWVIYVVHGFTGDGAAYQPVALAQMVSAIQYAKSLGDMWIGTMEDIGSYWLGQKAFSKAMTSTSGTSKTWTWTLPGQFPTGKYLRVKVDGGSLSQKGSALSWNSHGFYEIALDAGSVTLAP